VVAEGVRDVSAWSLLSGVIGALLVFCLGFARELWRDERERRGILRLLLAEIEHNIEVVRTVREPPPPRARGRSGLGGFG
jgi:hypothetical protein